MVEDYIKCPKCGSINIDRHWGDKILKGGAQFVGGLIEGYFLGGSGETGREIASDLVDEISQKYICRSCSCIFVKTELANKNFDNQEEKVCKGKSVKTSYRLYNDVTGDLLFETPSHSPDLIIFGVSQGVMPGLEVTINGLCKGDRYSVTLPPEVAFGLREEECVQQVPIDAFIRDGKIAVELKEGSVIDMMTNTGDTVSGRVIKVTPEFVLMDFNHPFAGIIVRCEGEIIEVTDAAQQDIKNTNNISNFIKQDTQGNENKDNDAIVTNITYEDKEYLDELKVIYSDNGQVSERERRLLNKLKTSLGISEDRAKELEDMARLNFMNEGETEYAEEIKACLEDNGSISERERRILNKLAMSLNISITRAEEIEKFIISK